MKLFVFLLAMQGLSGVAAFRRMCPTCVDQSYINFYYKHFYNFYDNHMPYPRGAGQCKHDAFAELECFNSCIRIQMREKQYDDSQQTRGWMYSCSTSAIKSTPPWLFLPSNLDNYQGNFSYVNYITNSLSYEVTLYENGSYVEKPEEYRFRMSGYSREVYEVLKRVKNPHLADVPFILGGCFIICYICYIVLWVHAKCENCCFKRRERRRFARIAKRNAQRTQNDIPMEPRTATIKRQSRLLPIPVEIPPVPQLVGTATPEDTEVTDV